jgi:hypothetical protein
LTGCLLVLAVRFSVDDDQDASATETNGARVDEMTEELSSFTPKSPISMPYIPDELNDPTAYPGTLTAFKEAQVKYKAKLRKPLPPIPLFFSGLQPPIVRCLVSCTILCSSSVPSIHFDTEAQVGTFRPV